MISLLWILALTSSLRACMSVSENKQQKSCQLIADSLFFSELIIS